jgi:hypothetical protein
MSNCTLENRICALFSREYDEKKIDSFHLKYFSKGHLLVKTCKEMEFLATRQNEDKNQTFVFFFFPFYCIIEVGTIRMFVIAFGQEELFLRQFTALGLTFMGRFERK